MTRPPPACPDCEHAYARGVRDERERWQALMARFMLLPSEATVTAPVAPDHAERGRGAE